MRAIVIHAARDLRIEERDAPPPGPGEVEVAIEAGGICGSDLHYFNHGGFGAVRLREPMILGHEVAGRIVALGPGVAGLVPGDAVAVSPSRPCGACDLCLEGLANHCRAMRFYGSAMPFPHIQGAFRQRLVAGADQCHRLAPGIDIGVAALAEPFAVALHAVARAGPLVGRRVLVSGCGPIGAMAIIAARAHGAREIVATDIAPGALAFAARIGADRTIDAAADPGALAALGEGKGSIDVQFEASGSEAALRAGLAALRPRGVLVQLGLGGDISIPQNAVVAKEIELRGTFRFHAEFGLAVEMINRRRVDLRPLLTGTFPLDDAVAAFAAAGDRSRSMKVQIAFQTAPAGA
jgi:Threonine dehydrogenase and related Zn-dependent dehydrogenases